MKTQNHSKSNEKKKHVKAKNFYRKSQKDLTETFIAKIVGKFIKNCSV